MKFQFAARVIGRELVEGDKPKTDVDRIKVKLAVRPVGQIPGSSGTMSFAVPTDGALRDFPLRRILLITCEEGQKELFEAVDQAQGERPRRTKDKYQTSMGLPVGDSPIATPPPGLTEDLARTAARGSVTPIGRARRRGGQKKSQARPESMH